MYEWEERKLVTEALQKEQELRKKELERAQKDSKKTRARDAFVDWLKTSLIKQNQEQYKKKMEEYEKQQAEADIKKNKANEMLKATIAYREWKAKKADEARYKKKKEKMEKLR